MKHRLTFLLVLVANIISSKTFAQIPCSSFCITDMQINTANASNLDITIFMTGNNNDFINYPYVSIVTDSNGDTIANGIMNFFGQIGNTSQTYTVVSTLTSIPVNFTCNVVFNYDTGYCVLAYPCVNTGTKTLYNNELALYPNPSSTGKFNFGNTNLQIECCNLQIFDVMGKYICSIKTSKNQTEIDLTSYPKGIYFLQITEKQGNIAIVRKLVHL